MKTSNIIIWLLGVGLIVFLCVLVSDLFEDKNVLYLDGCVLIFSYTLSLYVYGGLYVSREEFASDVPATGVKMYTLGTYCTLAIVCILIGYRFTIDFRWQLFFQLCLLVFVVVGMLLANASVNRLASVANESQKRHAYVDNLSVVVQQIQLAASLNNSLDPAIKQDISKFVERVSYISPSNSQTAKMLESSLANSVSSLSSLLSTGGSDEQISRELDNAKTILAQRIKTY